MRTRNLYCIVGPSGSGKTTLTTELQHLGFSMTRTTTTRARREDEPDDAYYFVTAEEFQKAAWEGKFAEYTKYCGNWYGSSLAALGQADLVVLEPEGMRALLQKYTERPVKVIYLTAPVKELENRLRGRSDDSRKRLLLDVKTFSQVYKSVSLTIANQTPEDTLRRVLEYFESQGERLSAEVRSLIATAV